MTHAQSGRRKDSSNIQNDYSTQWKTTFAMLTSGLRIHRYLNRDLFGSESLHSIISHLRIHKNYPIENAWVWRLGFKGKRKHVKEYYLSHDYLAKRSSILKPIQEDVL